MGNLDINPPNIFRGYVPPRATLASLSNLLWLPDRPSPAPMIGEVRVCGCLPPILHESSLVLCQRLECFLRLKCWITHTTSPSTSVAYTVKRVPKLRARPDLRQNRVTDLRVVRLTVHLLSGSGAGSKGHYAAVRKVAMVGKGVEARARTTNVVGARSHPSVVPGDVDQLVLAESGEWKTAWSSLPLFRLLICFWRISLLSMFGHELGVLKGPRSVRTQC